MGHSTKAKRGAVRFLFENSLFLVAGAVGALFWANYQPKSYEQFIHMPLPILGEIKIESHDESHAGKDSHADDKSAKGAAGDKAADNKSSDSKKGADDSHDDAHQDDAHGDDAHGDSHAAAHGDDSHAAHTIYTVHWLINDLLMALFFAIAGKEVWESLLPGGDLSNMRKAATPLLATVGGILGPAGLYLAGAAMTNNMETLGRGWAIPCATDIAFSYLVARIIFGAGHPAIGFLLLHAIADDAAGLVILAVMYPNPIHPMEPSWLLLTLGAMAVGYSLRIMRLRSFWWYLLIPGALSWFSFFKAGIHPALGLVPIIPTMPHAHTDLGIFARKELHREDTLNEFEHWWKNPVEIILGFFGLVNAGVVFSNVGVGTWLVLVGLLVGKPLGITLFTWLGQKWFKLEMPANMNYRHVFSLGMVAAIGFTVALFVSVAAFPVPPNAQSIQDSVKMGALLSFGAAIVAYVGARLLGVWPDSPLAKSNDESSTSVDEPEEALVS